jgi:fructose-1,6-bisphosphatase/inositol monophosphatase family enzyme
VREAGGVVTDPDGSPWTTDSTTLLAAADPDLHERLVALGKC